MFGGILPHRDQYASFVLVVHSVIMNSELTAKSLGVSESPMKAISRVSNSPNSPSSLACFDFRMDAEAGRARA